MEGVGDGPGWALALALEPVTFRAHTVTLSHIWLLRSREGTIQSQLEAAGQLACSAQQTVPRAESRVPC